MVPLTVQYQENCRCGRDCHQVVGICAAIGKGGTPDTALEECRAWVREKVESGRDYRQRCDHAARDLDALNAELERVKKEIAEQEAQLGRLRDTWEKAKDFLFRHGLDAEMYVAGLPFDGGLDRV